MGRMDTSGLARYDDLSADILTCYYCQSDKVKGWDYVPHKSVLPEQERGVRVRACINCLPRLHYHIVTKGNLSATLEDRIRLLGGRRISNAPTARTGPFIVKDGLLVPSDMTSFVDFLGLPSQFFVLTPQGPTEQINIDELQAAQLCIGATLLDLTGGHIDSAWDEVQRQISPGAFEAIRRRLFESP